MKRILLLAVGAAMVACGSRNTTASEQSLPQETICIEDEGTQPDPTSILYLGTFKEVNDDGYDAQLRMWAWEDELQIKLDAFYEERMLVKGNINPQKGEFVDTLGVRLPITLRVIDDGKEIASDEVVLTFTEIGGNLYNLHVDFVNEPSETPVRNLMADYRMFLTDPNVEQIVQTLPFKVDKNNVKLLKLLPELNKYVFMPELWTIVKFIKSGQDRDNLAENEMITIDERNRFFSYSWGDFNIELQGKYFRTDEGKILLIIDQHDATYEHDQNLQIFIIDPEHGTLTQEEMCNLFPKEYLDRNSIFQVRYATEGVVAVFADGNGGLDAKTLKFNGKTFE